MDSNDKTAELDTRKGYVSIKNRPAEERPRERLLTFGADKMSNEELLAILINKGTRGRSAIQVGEELLASCPDGLAGLARKTAAEIRKTKGLGQAATARVLAAMELGRRSRQRAVEERARLDTTTARSSNFTSLPSRRISSAD